MREIDADHFVHKKLVDAQKLPLKTYMDLTVGRVSFIKFILYEFVTLFISPIPGAIGFYLRRKLYPLLFKHSGRGLIIGRSVVIRYPHKLAIGDNVTIDDYAVINGRGSGENGLVLEDNVIVNRNCVLNAKSGPIKIGKRTRIGSNSFILSIDGVNIGEDVMTGAGCYINGGYYNYENTNVVLTDQSVMSQGPIEIGNGAWLGTGVIVLDGVNIGEGAVVGAGAVVMKNVSDYTIATGRPPVLIGNRRNLKSN